jgi:hypothetical protein
MRPEVVPISIGRLRDAARIRVGYSLLYLPDLRDLRLAVPVADEPVQPVRDEGRSPPNGFWSVPPTESETQIALISQIAQRASPARMVAVRQGPLKMGTAARDALASRGRSHQRAVVPPNVPAGCFLRPPAASARSASMLLEAETMFARKTVDRLS